MIYFLRFTLTAQCISDLRVNVNLFFLHKMLYVLPHFILLFL